MATAKNKKDKKQEHQPTTPNQTPSHPNAEQAHEQAEKDISKDPDLSIHSPNDDLDEGETARLGDDKTDLV